MIVQPKHAADPSHYYKPVAYQALTVDATVRSPTVPAGVRMAQVFFRVATVRMTLHGVDPVAATTGITLGDGYEEFFSVLELSTMRLVREGATSGEVHFLYYQ